MVVIFSLFLNSLTAAVVIPNLYVCSGVLYRRNNPVSFFYFMWCFSCHVSALVYDSIVWLYHSFWLLDIGVGSIFYLKKKSWMSPDMDSGARCMRDSRIYSRSKICERQRYQLHCGCQTISYAGDSRVFSPPAPPSLPAAGFSDCHNVSQRRVTFFMASIFSVSNFS